MSHYRSFEARVTTLPVFLFFFTIYIIIQTPSESYTYSEGFITTTPKLAPVFLLRLFSFHSREALKKRKIKKRNIYCRVYCKVIHPDSRRFLHVYYYPHTCATSFSYICTLDVSSLCMYCIGILKMYTIFFFFFI